MKPYLSRFPDTEFHRVRSQRCAQNTGFAGRTSDFGEWRAEKPAAGENFAILDPESVGFNEFSSSQLAPQAGQAQAADPSSFLTAGPADFRDVFLNGAIS